MGGFLVAGDACCCCCCCYLLLLLLLLFVAGAENQDQDVGTSRDKPDARAFLTSGRGTANSNTATAATYQGTT
jgi:hypothetical protein